MYNSHPSPPHESQFGFMPGRSTTDAIFILKQTIEKHRERQKDIRVTFVDIEKAYDRALSPCLFLILMDVLTEGVRKEVPESTMFADDIVLCGGREVGLTEYLDTWRKSLEERGMRISRPKTQFMGFNFEQNQQGNREPVKILGEELERVTNYKYLGTSMEEEGGMETEITTRVGTGWRNWKKCSGVGETGASSPLFQSTASSLSIKIVT